MLGCEPQGLTQGHSCHRHPNIVSVWSCDFGSMASPTPLQPQRKEGSAGQFSLNQCLTICSHEHWDLETHTPFALSNCCSHLRKMNCRKGQNQNVPAGSTQSGLQSPLSVTQTTSLHRLHQSGGMDRAVTAFPWFGFKCTSSGHPSYLPSHAFLDWVGNHLAIYLQVI